MALPPLNVLDVLKYCTDQDFPLCDLTEFLRFLSDVGGVRFPPPKIFPYPKERDSRPGGCFISETEHIHAPSGRVVMYPHPHRPIVLLSRVFPAILEFDEDDRESLIR